MQFIDRAASLLPEAWATRVRASALGTLAADRATDTAYSQLASTSLAAASRHARAADVRGIDRVRAQVVARDKALGGKRPAEVTAILAALDADADAARRLRLVARPVEPARAGPSPLPAGGAAGAARAAARRRAARRHPRAGRPGARDAQAGDGPLRQAPARHRLTKPPDGLAAPHALLQSAWSLAGNAVALRLRAVEAGDSARAAEASAAAAGALMLMARAREDIDKALKPPSLP